MLAKDYIEEGETVRAFVMRVLRETLTEQRTDDAIALLKIKGPLGFIVRGGIDALLPERFLSMVDTLIAKYWGDTPAGPQGTQ